MNEHLRAAVSALASAAADIPSLRSERAIRERLRRLVQEIVMQLDAADEAPVESTDPLWDDLQRKSLDIAEDLRRADRLMRGEGR